MQYSVRVRTKCVYQLGNDVYSPVEEEKVVVVNMAYLEQHVPFVRNRLPPPGILLADLLNAMLG